MDVTPVAFESLGVRGMATLVEATKTVFIDASAALGRKRYTVTRYMLPSNSTTMDTSGT